MERTSGPQGSKPADTHNTNPAPLTAPAGLTTPTGPSSEARGSKQQGPETQGWDFIVFLLSRIGALYARPGVLRRLGFVTRETAHGILALLEPAEQIARRLLLLMARREPPPQPTLLTYVDAPPAASSGGGRGPRFALLPRERAHRSRRQQKPFPQPDDSTLSTAALADRIFALIKVAANPAPYAKRLARKLCFSFLFRRSRMLGGLLRGKKGRKHRGRGPHDNALAEIDLACEEACRQFLNSS